MGIEERSILVMRALKFALIDFGIANSHFMGRKNSSDTCFFRKRDSTASWVADAIWQQHFEENLVLNPAQIPAFFENVIPRPAGSLMPSGSSTLKRI
jgi:hypothetical protein